jgi:hypothetical protein
MTTIQKKSVKVGKYVDTAHVDTVIRNYKKERWVHNSERIGKEDSLSVWYSVEELEDFIDKIKMHGADGIKFYFAAYSQEFAPKPEYADRQTVVLVATKSNPGEAGAANRDIYVTKDNGSTSILAYNVGSICPPYCSGGTKPIGTGGDGDGDDWGGIGITLIDRGEKGTIIV